MIRRAAGAARRIVVAEIMDRRWRRGGKPPVFNREAEEYVAHLNGYGYALVASERRPYERYNNEKWWAARDTRLTVLGAFLGMAGDQFAQLENGASIDL